MVHVYHVTNNSRLHMYVFVSMYHYADTFKS